jgi:hypothetical protein
MFWASHRPDREPYSTQYMAAAFPNAAQLELAIATRDKLRARTPVIENAPFYLAEDYHQKYYLRHDRTLMRELEGYSPAQLVDSTVTARSRRSTVSTSLRRPSGTCDLASVAAVSTAVDTIWGQAPRR